MMSILEKLTQQRLQEILLQTYLKVHESEDINLHELIEEIKNQLTAVPNHRS